MVKGTLNFFALVFGLFAVFFAASIGGIVVGAIFGANFWIGFVIVAVLGLWLLIASNIAIDRTAAAVGKKLAVDQTASGSRADELQKLAQLRESGALSEEEFNAEKARLLRDG